MAASLLGHLPVQGHEQPRLPEKCLLWKATSPTGAVYLLGSVHAASADFYPLAAEIEDAFAKSKVLVAEVNTGQINKAKLEKLVLEKAREVCFVIVGVGHLLGERGIVKRLEAKKYRLEQISRASGK